MLANVDVDEEDPARSQFFTTEVDFKDPKSPRHPHIGNVIALRETFLSEAPFVNRANKLFWKKWIESREYIGMLTAAFTFIQSCISEQGVVNLDKMNDVKNSSVMQEMSTNMADMFFLQKPRDRDIFFNRLPELLCFMIVNSLHASVPKHHRLYNSIKFRELLLDVLNELIGGIRFTDCRKNREWIFADAHDNAIMTSNTSILTNEAVKKKVVGGDISVLSSAQSTYLIGQSPLIAAYLGNHAAKATHNGLKLTLFHSPERPLMCLSEDFSLKRVRAKQITKDVIQKTVRSGTLARKGLLQAHHESKNTLRKDMHDLHRALRTNIAVLENKTVSKRHLIHAAQHGSLAGGFAATGSVSSISGNNNLNNNNSSLVNDGAGGSSPSLNRSGSFRRSASGGMFGEASDKINIPNSDNFSLPSLNAASGGTSP